MMYISGTNVTASHDVCYECSCSTLLQIMFYCDDNYIIKNNITYSLPC